METTARFAPASAAFDLSPNEKTNPLWIKSPVWDLTFISLSAVLVVLPFSAYYIAQFAGFDLDTSRNIVNGLIALFIGGPHMYATYTRTALDKTFTTSHPKLILGSLVIPVMVIFLGVKYFPLLLTFFFFWASVHVLHQIVYLVNVYNQKHEPSMSLYSTLVDYALVFTSLYPIAVYKLVHDQFTVGPNKVLFPDFLKHDATVYAAFAVFALSFVLFTGKTIQEFRTGRGHLPKTILMYLTSVIAFFLPSYNELDVAFQGFNTWHSFQYLGLTFYINKLRQERGEIPSNFINAISAKGWKYYAFLIGITITTVAMVGVLLLTRTQTGLSGDQCYYIVILSFLLTHYLQDHYLFTQPEILLGNKITKTISLSTSL
jgi:hypothetical protein